jgi:2-isopropylmalate synthase
MGVDIIEAGFPIASDGDFEAVSAIAKQAQNAVICGLARANYKDIDRCWEAVRHARRPRIHTFIGTSPLHRAIPNLDMDQMAERIHDTVTHARNLCDNVHWSPMDATRTEHDYLCRVVEIAIRAGATTINIPDTVGYTYPRESAKIIAMLLDRVPGADTIIFATHCHNDLGMATANALAAVEAGARQIECTINGLGERAGNTALEEVVMALKTRRDHYGVECSIVTQHIMRASRLVTQVTGHGVQVNKAIVGANAFAHESGIHQDGMLKNRDTYEIMTPESVGVTKTNLVMGKHSGRAAFKDKLSELGIRLGDNQLEDAFVRFKTLADKKKEVFDEDILALVDTDAADERVSFASLQIECGSEGPQMARLGLTIDGVLRTTKKEGNGPVDAIFKAIRSLYLDAGEAELKLYQVQGITGGTDAQAEVMVRLERDGQLVTGHGADVDTLVASAKAYVNALNKLERFQRKLQLTDQDEPVPATRKAKKVAG